MNKLFLIFLLVFLTHEMTGQKWITFKSEGGRFEIKLQEKPKSQKTETNMEEDNIPITYYSLEYPNTDGKTKNLNYLIFYPDHDEDVAELLKGNMLETFYDASRDELITSGTGRLLKETDIQMGGLPAKEYLVGVNSHTATVRYVFVGNRAYLIQVTSENKLLVTTRRNDSWTRSGSLENKSDRHQA